jgi:multiple sugar transport system ATP-binding protein
MSPSDREAGWLRLLERPVRQTLVTDSEIREVGVDGVASVPTSARTRSGLHTPARRNSMAKVEYIAATCLYPGNPTPAVNELNLPIEDGEFMVLVGPSGSGKSTALRMLAGLEPVSSGEIHIAGVDVARKPPKERDIAMVFQNYALYPHMSVGENMGFALKLAGVSKAERQAKVAEAAKLLDLDDYLDRKPKALSGGQRQRVAMGRAIVRDPSVFLMDEPLSNLDAKLRVETRANIAALQARLGTTTLYVTHDQVEAMTMGHRVAVLKNGILQQADTPRALYETPQNVFVAEFIGSPSMNLRTVGIVNGGARLGDLVVPLPAQALAAAREKGIDEVIIGLRPEALNVTSESTGLSMAVELVEELGSDAFIYGTLIDDAEGVKRLVARPHRQISPRIGDKVNVEVLTTDVHVFDPGTGLRLG